MCGKFFKRIFSPVTVCFFLFPLIFSSCGLETLYYLKPPVGVKEVNLGNEDRNLDFFSFYTGDNSGLSNEFTFLGTQICYKIFSDKSRVSSSISSISSCNSSTDVSAAANYLINSAKYVPLLSSTSNDTPIIGKNVNNLKVSIRLSSYDGNNKEIIVYEKNDNGEYVPVNYGLPKRYYMNGSKKLGFEFSREKDTDNNPIPHSGEEDVTMSSSTNSDGIWYVDVWAYSVGRDNSYSYSYSRAVHLGCVMIKEEYYKN